VLLSVSVYQKVLGSCEKQ